MNPSQKDTMKSSGMLLAASIIWGFAFVAQSVGADHVGPLTFTACRGVLALCVLTPFVCHLRHTQKLQVSQGAARASRRALLTGGLICGIFLFLGMILQQLGIAYTTVGKSGFITTTYVVMVPLLGLALGRKVGAKIWLAVGLSVCGLYLLSMEPGEFQLGFGDTITLLSAVALSLQITAVDHFARQVDPILLSFVQQVVMTALALAAAVSIEQVDLAGMRQAALPILYAGIFSSGFGLTLQIIGQRGISPTAASLLMSLESCFAVLDGWVFLGQTMSLRELGGCCLMFSAIVLSQLPETTEKSAIKKWS